MTPGNRRFVRTALAIFGLMALATATVWIVLFMFVRPARGDTVDARMFYVIDGDTLALAGERIRLLGIDAPETRGSMRARARRRLRDEGPRCRPSASAGTAMTSTGERSPTSSSTAGISVSSSCARSWRCLIGQARRREPHVSLSGASREEARERAISILDWRSSAFAVAAVAVPGLALVLGVTLTVLG